MQEILDSKKIKVLLADPYFNCTQNIDILLDGNVYADSMNGGKIQLGNRSPKLIKSSFDWIVQEKCENKRINEAFCGICNIPKLWELEQCEGNQVFSAEDQQAIDLVNSRLWFQRPEFL